MALTTTSIVEAAFGANLGAPPSTWTWTDITSRWLGAVTTSRGRPDETSQTQPSDFQLRLANTDGWLTPRHPSSPWYLQWGVGTPVRIRRRQVLVPAISDTFTQSVSSAWGTADSGQAWTVTGGSASDYSTTGTTGRHSLGSVNVRRASSLGGVSASDIDVTVGSVVLSATPTGASADMGVVVRYVDDNNFVDARAIATTSNTVVCAVRQVVAGVETFVGFPGVSGATATAAVSIRLQAIGPVLRAKVWTAASAEPDAWTVSMTTTWLNPGGLLLTSLLEVGNSNTLPVTTTWDNLVSNVLERVDQGNVASVAPVWPSGNSTYAEVSVTVKGALWRLNQARTLRSALYRSITRAVAPPIAYWSIEDGSAATQAAPGLPNVQPLSVVGTVRFGSAGGPAGSDSLADFTAGGGLRGPVPVVSSSSWRVEFTAKFDTISAANFTAAVQILTQGTVSLWEIDATDLPDGGLYFQYIKAGVANSVFTNHAIDDGQWHWFLFEVTQNGADLNWALWVDEAPGFTGTITGATLGPITYVTVNPTGGTVEVVSGLGHLTIWAPFAAGINAVTAFRGWAGETAFARITRLCGEEGVPVTVSGGIEQLGPQGIGKLVDVLRAVEAADHGVLSDGRGAGLTYLGRDQRENLPAVLSLDTLTGQVKFPGFEPVEDDLRTVTSALASRTNGSSASYTDPLSATAGVYDSPGTSLNVATDSVLLDHASWLTHLGTVPEMRAPTLVMQLIDHPELVARWLIMDIGARYTVANPPTQYPPGGLDLVLEQYREVWDATSWRIEMLGSPFAPWRIALFAADSGDTGLYVGHFETDDSALNASLTTSATSVAVKTNSGPLWTTASDDFPFDIDIDGEQVRVTNITGSSSPQTFTITRSINGVVKAHNANAPVFLFRSPVAGL